MYGFDYELEPANEGIKETFKNIIEAVGRKISEVSTWIRNRIISIGKWLKGDKSDFAPNDGNAKQLVNDIGTMTEAFIVECSKAINTMIIKYIDKYGKVDEVKVQADPDDHKYRYKEFHAAYSTPTYVTRVSRTDGITVDKQVDTMHGHMKRGKDVSEEDWNAFQERYGKLFTSMHADAEKIKDKLTELQSMPALSYKTTVDGYKKLRNLYDANGDFGKEWQQLKAVHDFANAGKIKTALGKIVSMYDVGVRAVKAFGNRLNRGNFRDNDGDKFNKGDRHYNNAKAAYYGMGGKINAAKVQYKTRDGLHKERELLVGDPWNNEKTILASDGSIKGYKYFPDNMSDAEIDKKISNTRN